VSITAKKKRKSPTKREVRRFRSSHSLHTNRLVASDSYRPIHEGIGVISNAFPVDTNPNVLEVVDTMSNIEARGSSQERKFSFARMWFSG